MFFLISLKSTNLQIMKEFFMFIWYFLFTLLMCLLGSYLPVILCGLYKTYCFLFLYLIPISYIAYEVYKKYPYGGYKNSGFESQKDVTDGIYF